MSSAIANRVSRLEKAVGSPDDELVEQKLSDEAKAILRQALRNVGILTTDEIEARVNERRLVPKSLLRPLSPEASVVFEQARLQYWRSRCDRHQRDRYLIKTCRGRHCLLWPYRHPSRA